MRTLLPFLVLTVGLTSAKIFEKCELAHVLENRYGVPREQVKSWVCIAQYESTFNTEAINHSNHDGSKDYGLFQLNNRYWCGDDFGQNVCGLPCSALLDDDLTDDLICTKKIIRETERIKGKGNGFMAWVAYKNRCMNRDLNQYIRECYTSNSVSQWNPAKAPVETVTPPPKQPVIENEAAIGEDPVIINNARVPIRPNHIPRRTFVLSKPVFHIPHHLPVLVNPKGYFYYTRHN